MACLPLALLLWLVLRATGGAFVYSLDDPYIHLALARSILHGTYGLNPGELSAPSSSILWPFLLAPFALLPAPMFELVPLAANAAMLAVSLWLIARQIEEQLERRLVLPVLMLLAWGLNLYGLVFTGMEHSLQILLVLMALDGFFAGPGDGSPRPLRFYVALVLLPLVRYEGLAVTAALLGYQFVRGDWRRSLIAGGLALGGVIAFSLYLHGLGLGWLPYSVIAKSTAIGGQATGLSGILEKVQTHLPVLFGALAVVALTARRDRWLAAALLGLTVLHFVLGRFGWFGRYEVYWIATIVVVALRHPLAQRMTGIILILAYVLVASDLHTATDQTPPESRAIHAQQGQMDRIVQLLDKPVAVNDIGLVTLHSRHYVLDLFGLSSGEALRQRMMYPANSEWIRPLLAKHGIRHVLIYAEWFPKRPAEWIEVARLTVKEKMALGAATVVLYATDEAAAQEMRLAVTRYRQCCAFAASEVVLSDPAPGVQ